MHCHECDVWLGTDIPATEVDGRVYCPECAVEAEYQAEVAR